MNTPDRRRSREERGRAMLDRALADPRHEFGSFFLLRLLGLRVAYTDETCTVEFDAGPEHDNPQGTLHGGVLATAMDISMGHLLNRHAGPGATLEMKVQYLAPVRTGLVRCEASFLRRGRALAFLESRASVGGQAVAHATATWKVLPKAP